MDESEAELDQIGADSEQSLSDADQTLSDSDQTSADRDQIASDRDQAASDRDLASGVDPHDHDITRDIRLSATEQRTTTARARLDAATQRDAVAAARDLAALARDDAARACDLAMAQDDMGQQQTGGRADFGVEILLRAAEQRKRAAEYRVLAAEHRALAAEDRQAAARDRQQAADERLRALADREILAAELAVAETDPLTGARTRAAGLADLQGEADRSSRTNTPLVVVYVDVIGLKAPSDARGHPAGDDLLQEVGRLFRTHLRSYDLIVRVGGDEFVCAISNISEAGVRERFGAITEELARRSHGPAIRIGLATLRPGESVTEVISRADAALIHPTHLRVDPTPLRVADPGPTERAD